MATSPETRQHRLHVPTQPTKEELHVPRIFASEECLERCNKLAGKAGEALLQALNDPDFQFDVVCHDKRVIGCGANVLRAGSWQDFGNIVEGTDELFVGNVIRYQGGKYSSVPEEIAVVVNSGVRPHHPSDIERR